MRSLSAPLWAITSYYNPARYRRRRLNFHAFRRHLAVPLLAIELSPDGRGELDDDEADIVLRLRGDDRIWQKERLLNLGMQHLPPHVSHVAWIDADLIFADPDWSDRARAALDRDGGMVQLFDTALHLAESVDPDMPFEAREPMELAFAPGYSIGRAMREGCFAQLANDWGKRSAGQPVSTDAYNVFGFAWAARRDVVTAAGLYDSNVIGGGDAIVAFAHVGQLEQFLVSRPYTEAHREHIRRWVARARDAGLLAHMGDVPQTAWHLWHGAIANRNYVTRYQVLVDHDYDPARDIVIEPEQPLRWADPGSAMANAVARYFFERREDGAY